MFHELGVDEVIEGGQTMNPSTEDVLGAIEKIPAKNIYILPNNGNIILAAEQAKDLTKDKAVHVIPTKNIPQGIAAMINFVEGFTPEQNEDVYKRQDFQRKISKMPILILLPMIRTAISV